MQLEIVGQHAAADGGLRFGANVAGIGLFALVCLQYASNWIEAT